MVRRANIAAGPVFVLGKRGGVRGFTLIELVVVMAIVALLVTLAAPRYFGSIDRAKESVLRENLNVMRDAIDKFHGDTGAYPTSLDQLVARRYLRSVPVDPITESNQTWRLTPPPGGITGASASGIYDVRSGALGTTRGGVDYADL
jgi:general secretion pathway protein G